MKPKTFTKLTIAILFAICFVKQSKAQEIPIDIADRINSSAYIFQGTVIRADCYWNAAHTFIYTSLTVSISKIFKGSIQCGTVQMITEGGQVGDTSLDISHNLELERGDIGIFLCKQTDKELPLIDYYPENNLINIDASYNTQSLIKYFNDADNKAAVDQSMSFDSLSSL